MADYPAALPVLADEVGGADDPLNAPSLPSWATHISQEVEALAAELGVHPSAAFSSVKERLDAVDAAIEGLEGTYAPLASPALTGNPTAPTQAPGTNSTRIATTAYTDAAIAALVGTAPGVLDTLGEISDAINDDANLYTTLSTAITARVSVTGTPGAGKIPVGTGTGNAAAWTTPAAAVAADVPFTPTGTIAATDVQAAIAEAASESVASLATKAPLTRTVGTALSTTGTVNLDMSSVHDTIQWIVATGNITFTTSNRAAGREVTLVIDAGGSTRTLAYPSWIAQGAALPTSLASGKRLVVSVTFLDTTDANASAAAAAQP